MGSDPEERGERHIPVAEIAMDSPQFAGTPSRVHQEPRAEARLLSSYHTAAAWMSSSDCGRTTMRHAISQINDHAAFA